MRRITQFIIFIISLTVYSCFAQNECEQLKNKEISLTYIRDNKEVFLNDIETLMKCYYDSVDIEIFKGPFGDNFEQMVSIIELADLSKKPKELSTYNIFIEQVNEIKKTEEYEIARQIVIAKNEIIDKEANITNWESDYHLLKRMNFTDNDVNLIKEIVKDNQNSDWTYYEVFQELSLYYQSSNTMDCPIPSYFDWFRLPYNLDGYFEYSEGLQCSKISNKPVLLYFTGHSSIKSREFEVMVLSDPEVLKILNQKFIITNLYTDDRSNALSKYFIYPEQTNDTIRQIGKINQNYQKELFNDDIQPAFYIIDSLGNQLNESYYFNESIDSFRRFLIQGLEIYYEQ